MMRSPPFRQLRRLLFTSRNGGLENLNKSFLPELYPSKPAISKTLIRPSTQTLLQAVSHHLNPPSSASIPSLYILDGCRGVGKSSIIQQTVAYARSRGVIVIYLPNARDWTHGRGFFAGVGVEGMDPLLDGIEAIRFYDRPEEMGKVFDALVAAHADALSVIECSVSLETDLTRGCESVLDLVEKGRKYLQSLESDWRGSCEGAGQVLDRVIRELSRCHEPVMVVIDNYEWLIGLTCMEDERKRRMHANSIRAVAQHFGRDAIESLGREMHNGFVLLATDPLFPYEELRKSRVMGGTAFPLGEDIVRDASGRGWLSGLKQRVKEEGGLVTVPELTSPELKALCSTFVKGGMRGILHGESEGEANRVIALAGGRADIMKRIAVTR
eukprot:GFKZ01007237.1.p1 GENE.GFKZ01007237.1~~GFKZ01007237.1.p1  ORF type:complete len:384 (+),score=52.21 GFKZ01007237.1:191-1342(+)